MYRTHTVLHVVDGPQVMPGLQPLGAFEVEKQFSTSRVIFAQCLICQPNKVREEADLLDM
jgi:hypothetical protein